MKKIVFTVTTDLSYDQRMQRICQSLSAEYDVLLVGRFKKDSIPLISFPFRTKRISCLFEKGKLFYIEYNIKLFFFLLFQKANIYCSIDLDTLVPGYLVASLKKKPLVYDAHEYFTEMIEIVRRPVIRNIWLFIEKSILPKIKYSYTVSEEIRKIYASLYHIPMGLIRNISRLENFELTEKTEKYIIYAGVVNEGRGLEELIDCMKEIPARLLICGKGDLYDALLQKVKVDGLEGKVSFLGYVPPEQLKTYIRKAYIGYLMLENRGLSYYYSLANKFFDYIHAGIPQVTIDFPEYRGINEQFKVAELIPLNRDHIKAAIVKLLTDPDYYQHMKREALKARVFLNWQKEEEKLLHFYKNIPA